MSNQGGSFEFLKSYHSSCVSDSNFYLLTYKIKAVYIVWILMISDIGMFCDFYYEDWRTYVNKGQGILKEFFEKISISALAPKTWWNQKNKCSLWS